MWLNIAYGVIEVPEIPTTNNLSKTAKGAGERLMMMEPHKYHLHLKQILGAYFCCVLCRFVLNMFVWFLGFRSGLSLVLLSVLLALACIVKLLTEATVEGEWIV